MLVKEAERVAVEFNQMAQRSRVHDAMYARIPTDPSIIIEGRELPKHHTLVFVSCKTDEVALARAFAAKAGKGYTTEEVWHPQSNSFWRCAVIK